MSTSRVRVNELRQKDADAWTAMLREDPALEDVAVSGVEVTPLNGRNVTRYLLTLEEHSDPIPFIGKKTNAAEARFYRDIAPTIPRLVPRCWLRHISHDWSWVVLADVPNHRPETRWTADDAEKVIAMLASFHGAFWQDDEQLGQHDSLDRPLDRRAHFPDDGHLAVWRAWDRLPGHGSVLSNHALRSANRLAPTFIRASVGLEVLRRLGGWPGIIESRHLDALADLLDDPVPILQPLRELPETLLHGDPSPGHWHLTLFGDRRLLDWSNVSIGPAVCDLVAFLEAVERLRPPSEGADECTAAGCWPISEETMVDSYLLRMHVGLSGFDARAVRQAIPAARCLHLITTWLPRFADWFHPFVGSPLTWRALTEMGDEELRHVGYGRLAGLHSYLRALFARFWHASRML